MNNNFQTEENPSSTSHQSLASVYPDNPFYMPAYTSAEAGNSKPWLFKLMHEGNLSSGCIGFMRKGRLNNLLEIPSLPPLESTSIFWAGLLDFCKAHNICELLLDSYGSRKTNIPLLGHELMRRRRVEYVLDLTDPDLYGNLSSNHKRNIKRAEKSGVLLQIVKTKEGCENHARLMSASMGRRKSRGESVTTNIGSTRLQRYIASGAGVLHQAVLDNEILSSILILKSAQSGYYHSAGTSPQGMKLGASQFLIWSTAAELKAQGLTTFNLGGADPEQEGLTRFKTGFSPIQVELEAASFYLCSALRRQFVNTLRRLR